MAEKLYTAEEMHTAFYSYIFTDDSSDADLPDVIWLAVLAKRYGELTGHAEDAATQWIASQQVLALKTRADGFEAFELAAFLVNGR